MCVCFPGSRIKRHFHSCSHSLFTSEAELIKLLKNGGTWRFAPDRRNIHGRTFPPVRELLHIPARNVWEHFKEPCFKTRNLVSWVKKKRNFFLWILNVFFFFFDEKGLSYIYFFRIPDKCEMVLLKIQHQTEHHLSVVTRNKRLT